MQAVKVPTFNARSARKKIDTIPKLTEYIRRNLGEPIIQVEVTDEQIEDQIFSAIDLFSLNAWQGQDIVPFLIEIEKGQMEFKLDERVIAINALYTQSSLSSGFTLPDGSVLAGDFFSTNILSNLGQIDTISMMTTLTRINNIRRIFDLEQNYEFDYTTKVLRLTDKPKSNRMLLELTLKHEPLEVDNIYNEQWVKRYSIALTKKLWGQNLNKFSANLVGGATINASDIISEANTEIEQLREELTRDYLEPAPFSIM